MTMGTITVGVLTDSFGDELTDSFGDPIDLIAQSSGTSSIIPTPPQFSEIDYLNCFLDLLPTGRIWDKAPGSPMYAALSTLMPTISRLSNDATNLIGDAFVATTAQLLPEWQATLGLPDACSINQNLTLLQSQQQVVARFIGSGGQSIPFITAYAANLGYNITIQEYTTFKAGTGKAGGAIGSFGIQFSWLVSLASQTILYFLAGSATAGQKLATLGSSIIECELARIVPANTNLYFNFV